MKFLTAGCGGGACLRVPAAASAERSGTDVTFRDRLCKENIKLILKYWSRGRLNCKALEVAEGWRKRRTKLVAALSPCDRCHPSCTSTAWRGGGVQALLCGCCQVWHCCKSALTEQDKIFLGFFSKGKCFSPCREGFARVLQLQLEGYRMSLFGFWMHLGLGNVDWQKCKF